MVTIVLGAGRGAGHQVLRETARFWFVFAGGSPCHERRHLKAS